MEQREEKKKTVCLKGQNNLVMWVQSKWSTLMDGFGCV